MIKLICLKIENLLSDIVGDLETNQATYEARNEEVYAYALQGAKCLLQNIVLQEAGNNYSQVRDKNMTENEGRAEHKFCSDNPLAKAVGEMSENKFYLDFKMVREDTNIFKLLHETMPTGSLGESYSSVMNILKSTYQINIAPSELYDGMILVYEATPIQVWDYMQ